MPRFSAYILTLAGLSAACCSTAVWADCGNPQQSFSSVIPCYREALASEPLDYHWLSSENLEQLELRHYSLNSQSWSPAGLVKPAAWQHDVDIYIPQNALSTRAVVFINNGTNNPEPGKPPKASTDMTREKLASLARNTRSIIVSVSNVPNQLLTYADDPQAKAEDDSVAHSWSIFMQDPQATPTIPLHVPMAATVSQVMNLAERELDEWQVKKFIVSGISKRGWTTWLAAIADPRVDAIAPFAIDLLGIRPALKHMYRSYGNNWPVAFYPYFQKGVDTSVETPQFAELMKIEDPLEYKDSAYGQRLAIPKYIINASGDDFYVPDNSRFYFDQLPGQKSLRMAPNSGHAGIRDFAEQSLTRFVNRIQQSQPLPVVTTTLQESQLKVTFSESPKELKLWQAVNPEARDFRHSCQIEYQAEALPVSESLNIKLASPEKGWQATYVEATFADGYVATTPVYITPDDKYPTVAPAENGPACKTLPGRGLGEGQE